MKQNSSAILEVQNLSNQYEGEPLLKDVSFSLAEGEILCLLGPSGSGKTTLLRLLAGLETESSGTIEFRGQDISPIPPHKRNFGMMFQEYALFPHKTVWQNVAFGLEMQQWSEGERNRKINAMLELVGLSDFKHRKIDELSGGERQRVALARSLAPEPQLLLLDEPLGSLDRTLRDRLTCEIRTILKALAVTAVFVTHDQAEAFSVGDKVAILHNGILQQFSDPENIYRNPKNETVARFLGFQNFINGRLDDNNMFHSPLGMLQIDTKSVRPRSQATLLIRPDGAKLTAPGSGTRPAQKLSGMVKGRQFQGSNYKMIIQVAECSLTVDLPLDPEPPNVGQPITIFLDPSALIQID